MSMLANTNQRYARRTRAQLIEELERLQSRTKEFERSADQHQRVNQAPREGAWQLSLIVDHLPALISYVDSDQRYCFVNSAYEKWFGNSQREVEGRHVKEVLGKPAYQAIEKYVSRALAGELVTYETAVPYRDGGERYIDATYVPDFTKDGKVGGFFVLVFDITERKRAEEVLREAHDTLEQRVRDRTVELQEANSDLRREVAEREQAEKALGQNERRFKDFANSASEWFWEMDLDLRFTFLSEPFEDATGVPPDQAIGKLREQFGNPDPGDERWLEHLADLEARRPFRDFQYSTVGSDGEPVYFSVSGKPLFDDDGVFRGYRGTGTNITKRKRVERALQLTQFAIDRAADSVFWTAPDGGFLYVNDSACRSLGYSREELLTMSVADVAADLMPEAWSNIWQTLKKHGSETFEARHRAKDGRIYPVEGSRNYIEFEGREFNIAFVRDISARVEVEQQLRQAQKMEAVGQLTGGVAHDFNNLLGVIMGNVELLAEELGHDEPHVRPILQAALRGAELTERLLAFSRRQPLKAETLELGPRLEAMGDMLRRVLGETIQLKMSTATGLWAVTADPGQLENALLNLAINARDAMPEGGKLTIEAANATLDEDYADSHPGAAPGDYVALAVSDTGCGMSPEVLEHAFEPFFTTKEVGEGSGLGLSMVYGFAKQSGGYIMIYSEEGHGSVVKLYLPRAAAESEGAESEGAESEGAEETPAEEAPGARGETVLVVEDDPAFRELAVSMLENLGYLVKQAGSGKAALAVLADTPWIDLLLSDVVLPHGLNGPELAEKIKRRYPAIKVLYMSGYTAFAARHNGLAGHRDELLNKPFRKREMALKLRDLLDR